MIQDFRYDALTSFHGLPIFPFAYSDPSDLELAAIPEDVEAWAWRVGNDSYGGVEGEVIWPLFLDGVDTTRVRALTLGAWISDVSGEGWDEYHAALLAAADRFPNLEALFISDVPSELTEVSWIEQVDPGPLLAAFPNLIEFGLRGTSRLEMEPLVHDRLRELTIQTGGLPPRVVRAVGRSKLPALTGLDLYLGTEMYEGGAGADDLADILSGAAFPALRHLGLRNAEDTDALAALLAHAPVVAQLESLDLALGMLGDEGAAALLAGQPLTHLRRLDLHHHWIGEEMIQRLWQALPGVEINVDEPLSDSGEDRFIAVAE
ncbi:STM4015 family protein [Catenulispora pinisilvae]|uniref:STM4015 family protein n=1 Tax=Catenulispora pinisilvae TaxID=2705253 RepID=UPI002B279A7B|nr:STM4015 family protein [Catenulispora pinisilvae]